MPAITEKGQAGSRPVANDTMNIVAEVECHSCDALTTGTVTITEEMVERAAGWLGGDTGWARSVLSALSPQHGDGT